MRERWMMAAKRADFAGISRQFQIDQVTARIIRNRDVMGEEAIREFLWGDVRSLHDPGLMKDMDRALDLVESAVRRRAHIRIIGDYDIDGVMATYILWAGLGRLGAAADTCIPDRIRDGYGLHDPLVEQAAAEGVELLLTCDNGIAAAGEIALAKRLGMQVVVTDHHSVPYREEDGRRIQQLPPADAVVDPQREDCPYPFKKLCGAAVAYKLIGMLYRRFGLPEDAGEEFLELAAIATVGDVMDLLGENRVLVREGLRRLSAPVNLGIRALIHACGLEGQPISAYHIGFVLGPCINAGGRLDTALRALRLLQSESWEEAVRLAGDLRALNDSRKAMTEEALREATELVEQSSLAENRVLVVYLPQCHESLAGIVAGRLRERYYRPSFVLTRGNDCVKGSGRSIEGYSMYEELTRCGDLFLQFGGHPMAAGLSLEEDRVEEFCRRINENCRLTEEELVPKITIDVPVPLSYVTPALAEELESLEPFGKGNPRPLFAQKGVRFADVQILGKHRNVVQARLLDPEGGVWPAVYFGDGDIFAAETADRPVDIIYYPEIHCFRGRKSLRIAVRHYR